MRRSVLIILVSCGLIFGLAAAAAAAPELDLGMGARAMGMAGAYVAVADDGTAPYWNPAGITQIKVGITPALSVQGDFTLPSTSIGGEFPPNLGNLSLQLDGMVGVVFKGFAISGLLEADAETSYDDSGPTVSSGDVTVIGTGMFTLAHKFGEAFALGANLKLIYGQKLVFGASDVPNGYYEESKGQGYAADLGALFKLGELVRIGAVVKNAYGIIDWESNYYDVDPMEPDYWGPPTPGTDVERLGMAVHLGAAVKTPVIGTLFAVQIDNDLDADIVIYRIGFEQSLLVLKLRGGVILNGQFDPEWITAGAGFKLGPVVMDVAAVTDTDLALEAFALTAGFKF